MNKIYCSEKSFDIGCRVVRWDEPGGFNFYPLGHFTKRDNISYDSIKNKYKQFTVHWAVNYRAAATFSGLKLRGLSVNFIIDDDDVDGFASIYQCLDCVHSGWSQGEGFNTLGAGVEISYMPNAWEDTGLYSEARQKRFSVPDHEMAMDKVHGVNLRVYLPTKAQLNSLYQLIWGYHEIFPSIPMQFPSDNSGYIKTVLKDPFNYRGLVSHYHLERGKVDTCGLDMKEVETQVNSRIKLGF